MGRGGRGQGPRAAGRGRAEVQAYMRAALAFVLVRENMGRDNGYYCEHYGAI